MNNEIRECLVQIVAREGLGIVRDPEKCERLLKEMCRKGGKEIFLLVTTLRAGVVARLLEGDGLPLHEKVARITKKVRESFALVEEAAKWAVEAWAYALALDGPRSEGTQTSVDSPPHNGSAEEGRANNAQHGPDAETELEPEVRSRKTVCCPNCETPIRLALPLPFSSCVKCPLCHWKFRVNAWGEVTDTGRVMTKCPNASCGHSFVAVGGECLNCPRCREALLIDGFGNMMGCRAECPRCGTLVTSRETEASVTCPGCSWLFEMVHPIGVVSGFFARCPYCEEGISVNWPGAYTCQSCRCPFSVDH